MSLKSGKHTCRVAAPINGWFCESKTGTAGLRLPLEITGGECNGAHVEYIAWLSHAALDRSVKTLSDVFGWDGNLAALASLVDSGPFVGRECEITVEDEEYNGKTTERWDLAKWGGAKEIVKADTDAIRQLAARWKSRTAAPSKPPAGRPATPPPPPARTTPPPAAAAATATATKPTTKDAAWAAVTEAWAGKDEVARNEAWSTVLARVLNGKPESALKPDEWAAIADEVSIPF